MTTDPDDVADDETGESPNREAARYRTRLRETETERDNLREQVTTLQRAEVERLAGEVLSKGSALWASGTELDDLLDDAGAVDADKVRDAVHTAREELGLAERPRAPQPDRSQGMGGAPPVHADFTAAFDPRRR